MALITQTELQQDRLEDGDAAVVLKLDGSFRIFNFHRDMDPAGKLSARQFEQGKALTAFAFLLRQPEMLDIVAGMATDPELAGPAIDVGRMN